MSTKTLFDLVSGDRARIVRIRGEGAPGLRQRLLDMALARGTELVVERHAPLGDPVEISLKGYSLALRMNRPGIEIEDCGVAGIAIAEQPQASKTSLFNHLTGRPRAWALSRGNGGAQEGVARLNGRRVSVVDLPGTYSLTAYSQEELVARNFIIEDGPDLVVDVLDASNLERHLYLAIQIMEMGAPLLLALNMVDVAKRRGLDIDHAKLSELLGVPVVPTVGSKGTGIKELLQRCIDAIDGKVSVSPRAVTYGHEVDEEVDTLAELARGVTPLAARTVRAGWR